MMQHFKSLETREKYALSIGSVFLLVFMVYQFIWLPHQQSLARLQRELKFQQQLNVWMSNAKHAVTGQKKESIDSSSLLSQTSSALKSSALKPYPHVLLQSEGNKIQLSFKSVPFSLFLQWMQQYWGRYALSLNEAKITATKMPGLVKASLSFSNK